LAVKQVPLSQSNTNRVFFITTDSAWSYYQACWHLGDGNTGKALTLLAGARTDETLFGDHCRKLETILKRAAVQRQQLDIHTATLRAAVSEMDAALARANLAANAPTLRTWPSNRREMNPLESDPIRRANLNRHIDQAKQKFAEGKAAWVSCVTTFYDSADEIIERIFETDDYGYSSEAYYWLNYLTVNCTKFSSITRELESKGLLDANLRQKELDPNVVAARDKLQTQLQASRMAVNALKLKGENIEPRDMIFVTDAYFKDTSYLPARIALGYHNVDLYKRAIRMTLQRPDQIGNQEIGIARDYRARNKKSYLRAYNSIARSSVPLAPGETHVGNRTAGLAVAAAHGALLPLSVRIVPATPQPERPESTASNYWGSYEAKFDRLSRTAPVTFGDYAEKNIDMRISAIEVYKWLCNNFPTNMQGKGIHIEFQNLFDNKGGPSAGVTMAVSAYSTLTGKPVLENVAMTGEIRSDGAVKAIGGAHLKISAACNSDAIETVLVPRENEPDLLFVPFDVLCDVAIVECNELMTYMRYATDPEFNKQELETLRKAQLLIRFGRYKEAAPLLVEVSTANPNIYSARRLLELLSYNGKLEDDV
jgi:hypothetical protein